jgi:hypothetical protein
MILLHRWLYWFRGRSTSSGSAFPTGFYESELSLSVTPVLRSLDVTPTERSLSVTQTERTLIFQER